MPGALFKRSISRPESSAIQIFFDFLEKYLALINEFSKYADYLAINISSPNTEGLRDFHNKKELEKSKTKEDTIINVNAKNIQQTPEGKALDKVGLKRYCCRRAMLSHIDLIEVI